MRRTLALLLLFAIPVLGQAIPAKQKQTTDWLVGQLQKYSQTAPEPATVKNAIAAYKAAPTDAKSRALIKATRTWVDTKGDSWKIREGVRVMYILLDAENLTKP